jgi:hypothetical protein
VGPGTRAAWFVLLLLAVVGLAGRLLLAAVLPGATVTSWFRTPWRNRAKGGKPGSLHQVGWAYDVVPASPAAEATLRRWFAGVLNEGDHLHVQLLWLPGRG